MSKPALTDCLSARLSGILLAVVLLVLAGSPPTQASSGGGELIVTNCTPVSRAKDICHTDVLTATGRVKRRLPSRLTHMWKCYSDVTRDGRWVACAPGSTRDHSLYVARTNGTHQRTIWHGTGASSADHPVWAPDGHRLAWSVGDLSGRGRNPGGRNGQYIATRAGTTLQAQHVTVPIQLWAWSPNGQAIVGRGPGPTIDRGPYQKPLELGAVDIANLSSGAITRLLDDDVDVQAGRALHQAYEPAWSPDGRWIAVTRTSPSSTTNILPEAIWVMRPDGSGGHQASPRGFLAQTPLWSPDGRTLAFYRFHRSGPVDIYTVRPDGSHLRRLTTARRNGSINLVGWIPKLRERE
jgi:Tol biopolymer transport system component